MSTIADERADTVFAALADATRRDDLLRAMGGDRGVSKPSARWLWTTGSVRRLRTMPHPVHELPEQMGQPVSLGVGLPAEESNPPP